MELGGRGERVEDVTVRGGSLLGGGVRTLEDTMRF